MDGVTKGIISCYGLKLVIERKTILLVNIYIYIYITLLSLFINNFAQTILTVNFFFKL